MAPLRFLLDTNIVSDLVRHPQGIVYDRIAEEGEETVCISLIVAAELRFGAARKRSERLTRQVEAELARHRNSSDVGMRFRRLALPERATGELRCRAMAMSPETVRQVLLARFPDAVIEITDLTGTQDHYRVKLETSAFRGQSRVQQHRLVYSALGAAVGREIHALALDTSAL
jgi:stress-induced morphogen